MAAPDAPPPQLWIETDQNGLILDWSEEAPALLGYRRNAVRRSLLNMLVQDRPTVVELDVAVRGHLVEDECTVRPKDRRGVRVRYRIERAPSSTEAFPILRWTFTRL